MEIPGAPKMKVCEKCGKRNKPIAKVCAECGAPLPEEQVTYGIPSEKTDE